MTIAPFDPLFGTMSSGEGDGESFGQDREFSLLVAACNQAFDRSTERDFHEFGAGPVDWVRFLRLARFHRVEGLAWRGLSGAALEIPPPVDEGLHGLAQGIAARNLAMLSSCADLMTSFTQAGVPILFVKGLTLAVLAYGDIAAKSSADIDILVAAANVGHAASIIEAAGFGLVLPGPRFRHRIVDWHRLSKESTWQHRGSGLSIDLHSGLADNESLIPAIGMRSTARWVEITGGIGLPTLPAGELAVYLAVHGSSSAWFRLKWLVDFAALLEREHQGKIAALYDEMQALGAGRAADQALLLADRLFGSLASEPALRHALRRRWASRRLADIAWRMLRCGGEPAEPTEVIFGTAPIHVSQLLLRPDGHYLAAEMAKLGRTIVRRMRFSGS